MTQRYPNARDAATAKAPGRAKTVPPAARAPATITRTINLLFEPDQRFEIRALFKGGKGGKSISRCFFGREAEKAAQHAARMEAEGAAGVYVTINPCRPDLPDRSATKDADSIGRRWLPIDFDPVRRAGISATDAEKAKARFLADTVAGALADLGWPDPILADSGNGWHLLYRVDLPADDGGMVQRVLQALDSLYSTADVKVDTSNHNPSRIFKLYGTTTRKGKSTTERPHRPSRIEQASPPFVPVLPEHLDALLASVPVPETPPAPVGVNGRSTASAPPRSRRKPSAGRSVADDFTERGSWDFLIGKGWTKVTTKRDGECEWTRPGKDPREGTSATTDHDGRPVFHNFSGNAAPFVAHETYSKFTTYALLYHNGDESEAAKQLRREGYGDKSAFDAPSSNGTPATPEWTPPQKSKPTPADLGVTEAHTIKPTSVTWEWKDRIAKGKFFLLMGEGADGKSQIAIALAAAYSTGGTLPGTKEKAPCRDVIFCQAEDGLSDTVVPRLMAAGADLKRIKFTKPMRLVQDAQGNPHFELKSFQDLGYWEELLELYTARGLRLRVVPSGWAP
jgi:AAA domain